MDFGFSPDNVDDGFAGFDPIEQGQQADSFGFMDAEPLQQQQTSSPSASSPQQDAFGFGAMVSPSPSSSQQQNTVIFAPQQTSAKKEWDLKKQQQLQAKATKQRAEHQANLENGKKELAKFQTDRSAKIAAAKAANQNDEKQNKKEQSQADANQWTKVASYCNLKQQDPKVAQQPNNNERMRSVLVSLKNEQQKA